MSLFELRHIIMGTSRIIFLELLPALAFSNPNKDRIIVGDTVIILFARLLNHRTQNSWKILLMNFDNIQVLLFFLGQFCFFSWFMFGGALSSEC